MVNSIYEEFIIFLILKDCLLVTDIAIAQKENPNIGIKVSFSNINKHITKTMSMEMNME